MISTLSALTLSNQQFAWIRRQIKQRTGIHLGDDKQHLVYGRLVSRLRELQLGSFQDYIELLDESDSNEPEYFVNALTTNVTSFFREPHHFDFLANEAIPVWAARKERARVWSAGCSNGMEPYSIAMVASEQSAQYCSFQVELVATDLNTEALDAAEKGIYSLDMAQGISMQRKRRFTLKGAGINEGKLRIKPHLTKMISFRYHNLIAEWPPSAPFDAIFCRNVVIYFDRKTQSMLWRRFAERLNVGGFLFVGHSELLHDNPAFRAIGRTIYQRV